MTLLPVRRIIAALLLFCVGILIPASATPVRICLLELELSAELQESKCCSDCNRGTEQPDHCCLDLKELPDALASQFPVELPAVVVVDVPLSLCPTPLETELISAFSYACVPIRGPTSPSDYRAVLGIWRI